MSVIAICISFQVAILGIAYPILLQVITALDNKYSSIFITGLFKEEPHWKLFSSSIVFALISTLLYVITNLLSMWVSLPSWVDYIPFFLVLISTITLLVFFYLFVKKVLVYYTPTGIVNYLRKKEDDEEHTNFKAISDILYQAIQKQDERIAVTISEYIYSKFAEYRKNNTDQPVDYPAAYYEMVHKTVEELALRKSNRFIFLEYRALGGLWLFGEVEGYTIHENTFSCQWRIILLALMYDRDDMLMHFWSRAHNYFMFNLRPIAPEFDFENHGDEPINAEEIEEKQTERARFLEFCNAFGGLALYRGKYSLLRRMFSYTNSKPPKYVLLPDTMNEVFEIYFKFRDPYDLNYRWITSRYYFPNSEGMNAEGAVKNSICKYAALLFLRQYSIRPHLTTHEPLRLPDMPETQRERKLWKNNIQHFKNLVSEVMSNTELMDALSLSFIDSDWCEENDCLDPDSFFDELAAEIDEAIEHTEINQPLSKPRVQQFKDSTNRIISDSIEEIREVFNEEEILEDYNHWFTRSITSTSDKSAFAEDREADHLNYDSFLASEQARILNNAISETFGYNKKESYLIKEDDFAEAINKITKKAEDVVLINFGVHLPYYIGRIEGLTESKFNDIDIINFKKFNHQVVGRSFYLLKKKDLPSLIPREIDDETIEKYSLDLLNDDLKIYASVIDLNQNDILRKELEDKDKDLSKSAFIYIGTYYEIRWKKNVEICELKIFSEYVEKGIPNSIEDVTFKLK